MRKTAALITILVTLITACSAESTPNTGSSPSEPVSSTYFPEVGLSVGDIAPDVELVALDGSVHKLSDYRGKVVFLNFWATWCGPCRYEMPSMEKMYRELKDQDFVILAVDVKESKEKVEEFFEEFELTFPAFLDEDGSVYAKFNKTNGIPQTYVIGKDGVIREHVTGARDYEKIGSRQTIIRSLKE